MEKDKTGLQTEQFIDEISGGFRSSQVLMTANRLGIFELLGESELTSQQIAEALRTDGRATHILCDALVGISVLERTAHGYRNTPVALRHLLTSSPESKTAMLKHGARLYERWAHLCDSVTTGSPIPSEMLNQQLVGGKQEFARAMADSARSSAAVTAEQLDLGQASILLDVGGGPGTFAIEFCARNPQLTAVVMDDAETLEVAARNIACAGMQDRIMTRPGDVFKDDMGCGYDFIFVSNLIHIYSAAENRRLVERCASALALGGRLGLKDFFLDNDRRGPQWSLLFAVNMLVSTENGDCYTLEEAEGWLEDAQLRYEARIDLTKFSRLLVARKAEGVENEGCQPGGISLSEPCDLA
jgi:precorrin-6B methylase 2